MKAPKSVQAGIYLAVVQDILGHSDIKTTMRYAHPLPENLQKAIAILSDY